MESENFNQNASGRDVPFSEEEYGTVVERCDIGAFSIILTTRGAMFETYTGYHVWTTPYSASAYTEASEKTLYRWLKELVNLSHKAAADPDGEYAAGTGITNKEMLQNAAIIVEANLLHPITAFLDEDRATKFAIEYMEWLTKTGEELLGKAAENVAGRTDEEDDKALAESVARQEAIETMKSIVDGIE